MRALRGSCLLLVASLGCALSEGGFVPSVDGGADAMPGLQLSPDRLTVGEGQSTELTVALVPPPADDVVVTLDVVGAGLGLDLTQVTLGPASASATVLVTGLPDDDADDATATVTANSAGLAAPVTAVTVVDDDELSIATDFDRLDLLDNGTARLEVWLTAAPTGDVEVTATIDAAIASAAPTSLGFTTSTWRDHQFIQVTGVHDPDTLDETTALRLTAAAAGLPDRLVPVEVRDSDRLNLVVHPGTLEVTEGGTAVPLDVYLSQEPSAPVAVSLAPQGDVRISDTRLDFDVGNWSVPQRVLVSADADPDVVGTTTRIDLSAPASGAQPALTASVGVTVRDPDVLALRVTRAEPLAIDEGAAGTFTVALSHRPPTDVVVAIAVDDPAVARARTSAVTLSTTTWDQPQPITLDGQDDANLADATTTVRVTAPPLAEVTFPLTVRDRDVLGLTVSGAPAVLPEGASATLMVTLDHQPLGPVAVTVTSSDPGAVAVPSAPLTFTPTDLGPRAVTLTALTDGDLRDESVVIGFASPALAAPPSLTVAVDDQTTLAAIATPTGLTLTEQGAGARVDVSLSTQPLGPVTLTVELGSSELTATATEVTFSTSDWGTPKPVTISAGADADAVDDLTQVRFRATDVVTATVAVTIDDDDVVAIVEDAPPTLTTREDAAAGADASFTVRLSAQPAGSVTVAVTSSDLSVATVTTGASLTFGTLTWDSPQVVRVHGTTDVDTDDDSATIRLRATGLGPVDVPLTVDDDDTQAIQVEAAAVTVTEGTTASARVRLAFQPSADVTISVASDNPDLGAPAIVTIPRATYASYVAVPLTAAVDADAIADTARITFTTATAPAAATVDVTVTDPTVIERPGWPTPFVGTSNPGSGNVLAYRITVPLRTTLDRVGLHAAAAGGDWKMAVYADAGNVPGALVAQVAGRQSIGAAGVREADLTDVVLNPGSYWLALRIAPSATLGHNQAATTTLRCVRTTTLPSLDDPWPSSFGAATCGQSGIYNLYLVTYRNP
jgi:hypothetical protein